MNTGWFNSGNYVTGHGGSTTPVGAVTSGFGNVGESSSGGFNAGDNEAGFFN